MEFKSLDFREKIIKMQNKMGFSITEVLVVTGLIGILALGFMKLSELNFRSTRTVAVNYELASFRDEIRQFLSIQDNCIASFIDSSSPTTQFPDSIIKFSFQNLKEKNVPIPKFQTNTLYRDGTLQIKDITVGPFTPKPLDPFTGTAKLIIKYKKQGSVFGGEEVTQNMDLFASLKGGTGVDKNNLFSCSIKPVASSSGGDCATRSCVRAEIEKATGSNCFETTGSCSGDYSLASVTSKSICVYVARDSYSGGTTASGGGPKSPGMMLVAPIEINGLCPDRIGHFPSYISGGYLQGESELLLTQKTNILNICCRKFPP